MDYQELIDLYEREPESFSRLSDGLDRVVYKHPDYPGVVLKRSMCERNHLQNRNEVVVYTGDFEHWISCGMSMDTVELFRESFFPILNPVLYWSADFKYIVTEECVTPENVGLGFTGQEIADRVLDKLDEFRQWVADFEMMVREYKYTYLSVDLHDENVGYSTRSKQWVILDYGFGGSG